MDPDSIVGPTPPQSQADFCASPDAAGPSSPLAMSPPQAGSVNFGGFQMKPRTPRRATAQPLRLDSTPHVLCYRYAQGRATTDSKWQGRRAHLHYFLPENWSPSYKFTVFEDSYVLSFERGGDEPPSAPQYHLARPMSGARGEQGGAPAPSEFELVWPMHLDRPLLEAVECACDRVVLGAKRRKEPVFNLNAVHLKLQKLDL